MLNDGIIVERYYCDYIVSFQNVLDKCKIDFKDIVCIQRDPYIKWIH